LSYGVREKKAKQVDPISERARALNEQISSLESEIKKLDTQLQRTTTPKFRSTAIPHGETIARKSEPAPAPKPASHEPVFEEVKPKSFQAKPTRATATTNSASANTTCPRLWERLRNHFRGPTTNNPRLVNYLAAGGVHGLRPMRYEKRVARNRFIALVIVLFLILLGVISIFVRNH
jgi:cell division protein FtsB